MSRLVVIDDNPMEHMIIQRLIEKYHIFPETAFSPDAEIIIELIEQHRFQENELPDIILLDLNMPGMNGWVFLALFEKSFRLLKKPIHIYICSSSVDKEEQALALSYPFVRGFLQKPVKADTLVSLYASYSQVKRLAS